MPHRLTVLRGRRSRRAAQRCCDHRQHRRNTVCGCGMGSSTSHRAEKCAICIAFGAEKFCLEANAETVLSCVPNQERFHARLKEVNPVTRRSSRGASLDPQGTAALGTVGIGGRDPGPAYSSVGVVSLVQHSHGGRPAHRFKDAPGSSESHRVMFKISISETF